MIIVDLHSTVDQIRSDQISLLLFTLKIKMILTLLLALLSPVRAVRECNPRGGKYFISSLNISDCQRSVFRPPPAPSTSTIPEH